MYSSASRREQGSEFGEAFGRADRVGHGEGYWNERPPVYLVVAMGAEE